MRKLTQKSISLLLALVMLLGMLPSTALAAPNWGGGSQGSLSLSGVPVSTITFRILNGTWSDSLKLTNTDENDDDIPDVRVSEDGTEVIFQSFYWSKYGYYVYGCSMSGDGPMEKFMDAILGNNNTLAGNYIVPDTGYTLNGLNNQDWTTLSGGISGSTASANSQMQSIKNNIHGYDDHMAPSGGFKADTVYVLTLTKDPTQTYAYTGTINNGGTVTNPSQTHLYKETSKPMVFTPATNYQITGVTVSVNKAAPISYESYSGAPYVLDANGSFTFPAEAATHDVDVAVTTELITYTVTYTDGLADREVFKDQINVGLVTGADTPGFNGGTPEDPQHKLVFTGWSPTVSSTVTGDVTYTAQWKTAEYTVTWYNEDGTELEVDKNVPNGTTPTYNGSTPTKPSNAEFSYDFIGWDPAVRPVNGADQEYRAVFAPVKNCYTVTWKDGNTVLEKDENVEYGTVPSYNGTLPAQLAANKNTAEFTYTFDGWSPAVDVVTGDITYKTTYTRTTNKYTVTWLNYNDNSLRTDTVEYGTKPSYGATDPERVATAQYTYTFDGWKNTDGTDNNLYASNGTFPVVTKDVTYKAQYTPVEHTYTVTLKLKQNGVLVDSAVVHGTAINPYISSDNGSTLFEGTHTATGTYKVENVPNGTYGIYNSAGTRICDQIIIVQNDNVEKECHYYTVSYTGNGASSRVPDTDVYHLGKDVTVQNAPIRSGYTFKGWMDTDTDTIYQPGDPLTPNTGITRAYTLTAQWEKKVNVSVEVTIDHKAVSGGHDQMDDRDEVQLALVSRVDNSSPYLEVPGYTLQLSRDSHDGFVYSVNNDTKVTKYEPDGATFTNMTGGTTEYSVVASKSGYNTVITPVQDADGNWTINVVMTYKPDSFDLDFTVEVDEEVPAQYVPKAAIVRVTYWNGTKWDIITQHDTDHPGVRVDIDPSTRTGSGSYPVWMYESDSTNPYGYRIKVTAFVYPDGTIVPASDVSTDKEWSDGVYTATMGAVTGGTQFGSLKGAYYDGSGQKGTLSAEVTMQLYELTFKANGGEINGDSSLTLEDQYCIPALGDYVPVRGGGYIFDAWYLLTTDEKAISGYVLTEDTTLVARWKAPWTITGQITADSDYTLGGQTKIIHDADRIKEVTVLLQYAPAGSSVFTNKRTETAEITYNGDNDGIGHYEFVKVPNDGGTWRVHVLSHNYAATYDNEATSSFGPELTGSDWEASPNIAKDVVVDAVATVDVNMAFTPDSFDLKYKVDASEIGTGFAPEKAEVLVLYDATTASESPREWPVISQMQDGNGGYNGDTQQIGSVYSYSVWKNHPVGLLYDYAIEVEAVGNDQAMTDLNGNEPFTVEYNGSAEYLASDGYENQTQLLIAKLMPKSYPVKYYLEVGSDIELHGMEVTSHTWSKATALTDTPTRVGYVFAGWLDDEGQSVTSIDAAVAEETKLYAIWEADNWKDAEKTPDTNDTDSPAGGDGIPDSQQIRIVYTTDGRGTTAPLGEIVTPDAGQPVVGTGSTATALPGYAFDGWTYIGSSDSGDDATAVLTVAGTELTPEINGADGGNTYTFQANFATDNWKDAEETPDTADTDSPYNGDGIPDKYQAAVAFHSANSSQGTVSGNVYQVTTFAGNAASGTVTPDLDDVTVAAEEGWAFDYWTKDQDPTKLHNADIISPYIVGGDTVIHFYAHFAIDEWKDDPSGNDSPTDGDGIPDHHQALVTYIPAANGRGTVTGKDAVQVFTLPADAETIDITPVKDDLTVTPNSGYAFDYWGDLEGFWGPAGTKVSDEKPFETHANVPGGDIITYVAHFGTDNWDQNTGNETGGDGIPDSYQKPVKFVVVNGSWNDGTKAERTVYVTLMKDGKWDISGSGSLTAPAVGEKPDSGYKAGSWDAEIPATVTGTGAVTYTYTYARSGGDGGSSSSDISTTGSVTLTKVDAADPSIKLANVHFNLYKADGTLVSSHKTGADGTITVKDLPTGKYYWVETRPAAGYTLDNSQHPFTISQIMSVSMTISNQMTPVPSAFSGEHDLFVVGYPDGTVRPEGYIVRSEVAAIFYRLLSDEMKAKYSTNVNSFPDIEEGMWCETAVSTMAAMGVVCGYPNGNFGPNDYITRAEFATMASRFDSMGNDYGVSFDDIYEHWAMKAINIVANNGWVLGYEDGTFKPDQHITRAEAMTMFNRVLQRVPESEADLLPGMKTWPDNADPTKWYYLSVQEATNSHDYERKANGYEYWTELRKDS